MQIYLVGGAVRDQLLGLEVNERDYLVVGASEDEMLGKGFRKVGKDFPVFLHPDTHEEYALARTERKKGTGYYGFEVNAAKTVTLEEDLKRRDLTINAMAMDEQGQLIDPYGGATDLQNRILRHISPAFAEDPLRVLRVARFHARFAHLGFKVADETLALMQQLASSGELETLPAERVWQETHKALCTESPQVYFETLRACGGLKYWFREVDVLWGIPNPPRWHPEIDTGIHTMMVLQQAARLSPDAETRFAALCHDLGKGATPKEKWPSHPGHEKAGVALVGSLCRRLKTPKSFQQLAALASEYHLHLHRLEELRPKTILKVLNNTDAFRKPERFRQFLLVCEADFRGRTGFEDRPYPQRQIMLKALTQCQKISGKTFAEHGLEGPAIRQAVEQKRQEAIRQIFSPCVQG